MKQANSAGELYNQISARKELFLGVFFVIILISYTVLYIIDFIPEPIDAVIAIDNTTTSEIVSEATVTEPKIFDLEPEYAPNVAVEALPISITFDALDGKTIKILNPTSRSIPILDEALLSGAVRHPDSADFSDVGNVFILGHSSYLPNVFNKNFQAFNGLQNLTWGDIIRVRSNDTEYVYRVDRVFKATASALDVPNSRGEAKLTLATCNSFGSKDDRFIVEASLVNSITL